MSSHKGPPEGAEVVDFQELRAAIEAAIADSRGLHETSKEDPSLIPNKGVDDLLLDTKFRQELAAELMVFLGADFNAEGTLGKLFENSAPLSTSHQAALMAEWLRKPESQTELIPFIKEQFLDEELRTILQLVLDADFDAKKIILKLLENPSQLSTAQLLYDGYIPILTRSTKGVRAAAAQAYRDQFRLFQIQTWPEIDDKKTAKDFLLQCGTAKVALEEYINQCGGIQGVNLLPVPKNNAELSRLWGQMSALIEKAMLFSHEGKLQKMTDLRLLLTMAYIEENCTTDGTDGDSPLDGISNGTRTQVDGALS